MLSRTTGRVMDGQAVDRVGRLVTNRISTTIHFCIIKL